ncbi:hypothetical protein BGX34_010617 [Mortierella sp. NVP85]|nr:hypothetical protein BGX34_010617 [Mortierella sp. NVP85]
MDSLDIPEITSLICQLLGQDDLASCVRVCKAWRDIFLPYLWRSVVVHTASDSGPEPLRIGPSQDDIYNRRHLIHILILEGKLAGFDKKCYPNLHTLAICFESDDGLTDAVETISVDFIKTFPSLVSLALGSVELTPTAWMTLSALPHIKGIELDAIPIRDVDAPAFWKVCEKLESLQMSRIRMRDLTIPADTVFHRIRHLEIEGVQQPDLQVQMDLILRCPSSEYVSWHIKEEEDIHEQTPIHHPIQNGHWPHLKTLNITHPIQDTDMATIIKGVGNGSGSIVNLSVNCTELMDQAFKAIGHHFSTLVIVCLFGCHPGTSPGIRDILCGCPKLEILQGASIYARDIVEGGPWVCLQLEELEICFLMEEESDQDRQPLIFEHLSTLVRLERLLLRPSPMIDGDQERVLAFRLGCGVDKLASLQQLNYIHFGSGTQPMDDEGVGMEEIEWMIKNWKRLRGVQGCLTTDKQLEAQLICKLQSPGIEYCPFAY